MGKVNQAGISFRDWPRLRLKYVATVNMGQSIDSTAMNQGRVGVAFIQGTAEFGTLHPEPKYWTKQPKKLASLNDLLFSVRAPVGELNVANRQYGIGRGLCAIRARNVSRQYLYWQAHLFGEPLSRVAVGSTYDAVTVGDVANLSTVIPPQNAQEEIAQFLDVATTEIQALLAKKRHQIDLLAESKQIIVTQAITRGLNADVSMKDSGIAWLGEIPSHWEARRARFVFREIDERSADGSEELLSVSHLTGVTPRSEKNVNMFLAESYEGYKTCQTDDLVINIMWAWMGALGVASKPGIVSSAYGVYRFRQRDRVEPQYFDYLLRIPQYIAEYNRRSTGIQSSRLRLYPGSFFDIRLLLPPLVEQQTIVAHIKEKSTAIDAAIAKIEREIELVQEYRTVLIFEAVTGKLKIPEARQAEAA